MITAFIYDVKEVTTKVKVINHIEIKCDKCGKIRKNKAAKDDNFDLIIKLSANGALDF